MFRQINHQSKLGLLYEAASLVYISRRLYTCIVRMARGHTAATIFAVHVIHGRIFTQPEYQSGLPLLEPDRVSNFGRLSTRGLGGNRSYAEALSLLDEMLANGNFPTV